MCHRAWATGIVRRLRGRCRRSISVPGRRLRCIEWGANHGRQAQQFQHRNAGGQHVVQYYSTDAAGNSESVHTLTVKIDTQVPSSHGIRTIVDIRRTTWSRWSGAGQILSLVRVSCTFDVQYKDGKNGAWVPWRTATDEVSDVFVGERSHIYYFRSRASDLAGNVEPFPAGYGDRQIYIEPVDNGRFETQDLLRLDDRAGH